MKSHRPDPPGTTKLRRRAEARLQSQSPAPAPGAAPEAQRLVHELQVHKLELEMQNEELRSSRAQVEAGLQRYTELYDFAPVGYFSLDLRGTITKTNLAGARLLGRERTLLLGKRLAAFVAEADLPSFNALLRKTLDVAAQPTCEVTLTGGDGVPRIAHLATTLSPDKEEFQAVATDITERKQTEAALRGRDQRLSSLINSAMDAIITVDENDRIVVFNMAACEMFRCARADAIGQPLGKFLPEQPRPEPPAHLGELGAHDVANSHMDRPIQITALRADGTEFPSEAAISHVEVKGRQLCSVILRDLSARVAAEAARDALEARLRVTQKMEAIGVLASGIAHDFNNILAAIDGYTELAKSDALNNPAVLESLKEVSKASGRATTLVRQILTFSRQEEPPHQPLRLAPVVQEALKLLRASVPSSIEFQVSLSTEAPMVMANSTQIHQIVMNLGANAAHAMRGGTGRLTVTLESCLLDEDAARRPPELPPGPYVCLSVTDTGHGMDQATAERVFEPFFTTKGPWGGSGLGLSVVHGIISSCQGAITVSSQPGQGATFALFFPAQPDALPAPAAAAPVIPRGSGERILFVDDEEALGRFVKRMLEKLGYVMEVTTQPQSAIESVRAKPDSYALVIADLTMPGLLGTELAKALLRIRPGLPIILTSGYAADLTADNLAAIGITEVLSKPFSLAVLSQAIHQALTKQA